MGLGSTAKKIQVLAERAEQLYAQVGELREQLGDMRLKLDDTHESVRALDHRTKEQRVLLEALAREQGLDPDALIADASIVDAEAEAAAGDSEPAPADADEPVNEDGG